MVILEHAPREEKAHNLRGREGRQRRQPFLDILQDRGVPRSLETGVTGVPRSQETAHLGRAGSSLAGPGRSAASPAIP